ncbi:MAG: hypothetical protein WCG05_02870 [Alphaproteobacteria bacterium]
MTRYISLILVLLALTTCERSIPDDGAQKDSIIVQEKTDFGQGFYDPVTTYCDVDCKRCGFNPNQCLKVLKENLSTLCNNDDKNCYLMWLKYAEDCANVCGPSHRTLINGNTIINDRVP